MPYQKPYQQKTPYVPKPDSGSLKSSISKFGPTSPDYWGDIHVNLKDMTNIKVENGLTIIPISGWKRVGNDGKTFLSLSVKRTVPKQEGESYSRQPIRQEDDFGDKDFPF